MSHAVRSVALTVVVAALLSACGLVSGLIPDQELEEGVLGLGGGVVVTLEPTGVDPSIDIVPTATTWVGTVEETVEIDALDVPNVVSPDAITEAIELGGTIEVRDPAFAVGDYATFTVTGLALGGTFTIGGATYDVPDGLAVDGLAVVFANPDCADVAGVQVCTYTTASGLPSLDLAFTPQQVAAYWALLSASGGVVSVDLTVTVTLAQPGLPSTATVLVTIGSGGATIEF
jgi:hypothetical protein